MVYIDFQPGSHGNYLEFVCNKFLADVWSANSTPFNTQGASHNKSYTDPQVFKAWHYSDYMGNRTTLKNSNIISIRITPHDLLPLTAVSLLRAGDFGFDNNELEYQTFSKLNNEHYTTSLKTLIDSFFVNQVKDSYDAVKDPAWPDVNTVEDFRNLPHWIQDECVNVHGLYLLDPEDLNCPRWVLREFFKFGFKDPDRNGLIQTQNNSMVYESTNRVLDFPFSCFYNTSNFTYQMRNVAHWLNRPFEVTTEFVSLHEEFLSRQPYIGIKQTADAIVDQVINGVNGIIPEMDLLEESYISAMLENHYNKELPSGPASWPNTLEELREQLA